MMLARNVARHAFRNPSIRRAALSVGALRGHALVLVFHRITPEAHPRQALIPSVPERLLRQQIEALLDAGEIVSLEDLLIVAPHSSRPRFALTFDDDWFSHYERALPVLQDLNVTATFFLSGRSLHRLGPLWFETLDGMIADRGIEAVAQWLAVDSGDPEQVARLCENEPSLQQRIEEVSDRDVQRLGSAEIAALAGAGMAVGFHTLQHPLLSRLSDSALDEALVIGRSELEVAAGSPIRLFAYPHGKPDPRAVTRLPAAGFTAACTGRPLPVRPGQNRYLLGRWEPGPIDIDRFITSVATRLNGWSRSA